MRASSIDRQINSLEAIYAELLVASLRRCASGKWGLFGHNRYPSSDADELLKLGSRIDLLRRKCGREPFALHERLLQMRSSHHSNTPGEPKLAQQWIEEMT